MQPNKLSRHCDVIIPILPLFKIHVFMPPPPVGYNDLIENDRAILSYAFQMAQIALFPETGIHPGLNGLSNKNSFKSMILYAFLYFCVCMHLSHVVFIGDGIKAPTGRDYSARWPFKVAQLLKLQSMKSCHAIALMENIYLRFVYLSCLNQQIGKYFASLRFNPIYWN